MATFGDRLGEVLKEASEDEDKFRTLLKEMEQPVFSKLSFCIETEGPDYVFPGPLHYQKKRTALELSDFLKLYHESYDEEEVNMIVNEEKTAPEDAFVKIGPSEWRLNCVYDMDESIRSGIYSTLKNMDALPAGVGISVIEGLKFSRFV